jgi:hypothetical protein
MYQQKAWLLRLLFLRLLHHAVLAICGFANVVDHMSIINNEGFQLIADFGVLEDKDVFEMVKRLGNCMVAAGHVNVGAIQVKKLQAFCYWVCDQQKHGQGITQDDWDDDMVMAMIEKMHIKKGQDNGNVSVMDLGKFNPDDFKTHKPHLLTCWHKHMGDQGKNLKFIMRGVVIPGTCISYPLQTRLTARTISRFTICLKFPH